MDAGQLDPLVLIHGEEAFLVDTAAREWRDRAGGPSAVEVVDGPARLGPLATSLMAMPLFDDARHLLIRDPPQLSGSQRRGADGAERLATLLEQRAPTTRVCLVAHATVAASNPVRVAILRLGGRVVHHPSPRGRDLSSWVASTARARGVRLPAGAVDHLVRVAGPALGAISGELDKLEAYAAGRPLRLEEVRRVVAGDERFQMWSVLDLLLGPEPARGAAALDSLLAEGRSSQYLLATLGGQLRELIVAQAVLAEREGSAVLATELGIPTWRADRLARQARAAPPDLARHWLADLQRLDARVKAGEGADADGLRCFALRAADSVRAARTATSG